MVYFNHGLPSLNSSQILLFLSIKQTAKQIKPPIIVTITIIVVQRKSTRNIQNIHVTYTHIHTPLKTHKKHKNYGNHNIQTKDQ